jgi:hypothetical protein
LQVTHLMAGNQIASFSARVKDALTKALAPAEPAACRKETKGPSGGRFCGGKGGKRNPGGHQKEKRGSLLTVLIGVARQETIKL